MNTHHPTRRKFLANMAVVSTGAVFRPFTQLLAAEKKSVDLHQQWAAFCKKNKSVSASSFVADTEIQRCKGHRYEVGNAVCFENENLLAQPTWIYWKKGSKRADDVVISFFEKSGEKKKLFRLNRFELESLSHLQSTEAVDDCLQLLQKSQAFPSALNRVEGLRIQTKVTRQSCSSTVKLSLKNKTVENKFIHSI